jgi:hypothetical protein
MENREQSKTGSYRTGRTILFFVFGIFAVINFLPILGYVSTKTAHIIFLIGQFLWVSTSITSFLDFPKSGHSKASNIGVGVLFLVLAIVLGCLFASPITKIIVFWINAAFFTLCISVLLFISFTRNRMQDNDNNMKSTD